MSQESHLVYDEMQTPSELIGDCEVAGAAIASVRRDLIAHQHDRTISGAAAMTASLHLD